MLDELLAKISNMSKDDKAELIKEVEGATCDMKWIPNPGAQTEAYMSEADITYYGGAGGGGKGLLPHEKIITPFGYRKIGDLSVGDRVLASSGVMCKVIGVYPQPKQQVFKVKFADGGEIVTDGPHRWNYSISSKGKWRKSGLSWKVGTTEQMQSMISDGRRVLIPLCDPLKINKSYRSDMRVIDPYELGLLLGDGYIAQAGRSGGKLVFSSEDQELVDALSGEWKKDSGCDYRVVGEYRKLLHKELPRLGLVDCKSNNKFIPEPYKLGSVEQRYAMLQGLMDTDGTITKDGKAYYCSVSEQLAKDVRWLIFSLGGKATITTKKPFYTDGEGKRVEGQLAYNIYIRMPDNSVLFRLKRKKDLAKLSNGGRGELKRRIESIEQYGEAETVCIAIDHHSSLYVAGDDLIVTHNTDWGLGLAFNLHQRTLMMRRKYTDLSGMVDRAIEINGTRDGFNGSPPPKLRTKDNRLIEFGAAQRVGDEQSFQGRPHDLLYIDEAAQFAESQVRFLMGWVRSATEGQRCRVALGSNPPLSDEGAWLIAMFAPWLDPAHHNPAKTGELRWYVTDAGTDYEVPSSGEYAITEGKAREALPNEEDTLTSMSRTFIPAKLKDNPQLMRDKQYKAQQDALPEHLRNAIRDGNFNAAREDHELQLIPSHWITEANNRWRPQPLNKAPQCAIGVDVAQGGKDRTILAPRYDGWYAKLIKKKGIETPDGKSVAGLIIQERTDNSKIVIDMGGGYGGAAFEKLAENINEEHLVKHKGSSKSSRTTKNGSLPFFNKRAEVYYRFYEALDPSQPGGSPIALPPDPMLFAQLCSIRLARDDLDVIQLEPKTKLVERTGNSPDEADAVVQAWSAGPKQDNFRGGWSGTDNNSSQRAVKAPNRSATRFDNQKSGFNNGRRKW